MTVLDCIGDRVGRNCDGFAITIRSTCLQSNGLGIAVINLRYYKTVLM